jgi:TetR/AcrR family transcriptional regulator, transcriptional repressor for nem operon
MPKPNVREKLVGAALDQFHRVGFNGSSVEDITTLARVPKGSFYNHFKHKEDLAVEVIDRYVGAGPHAHLAKTEIAPLKRLKQYFSLLGQDFVASGYKKGCLLGNFSMELSDHVAPVQAKLQSAFCNWIAGVAAVIREAQAAGEIEVKHKPEALAGFLISAWEGTMLRVRAENDPGILKEFSNVAFDQLLK